MNAIPPALKALPTAQLAQADAVRSIPRLFIALVVLAVSVTFFAHSRASSARPCANKNSA